MSIDETFNTKQQTLMNYILQTSVLGARKWSTETKSHFQQKPPKPAKKDFRKELKALLIMIKEEFKFQAREAAEFEKNAKLLKKDQRQSSCCQVF